MGKNAQEVKNYIRRSLPDIVGLQEVVEINNSRINLARDIAEGLGYSSAFFKALELEHEGERILQGNAILSRYPILSSAAHMLSSLEDYTGTAETQPRVAVEANIQPENGKDLSLFCTHLAYSPRFAMSEARKGQIAALMGVIPESRAILMGDFNSDPKNPELDLIRLRMINTDPDPTLKPTWTTQPIVIEGIEETELRIRLDHIFVTPDIQVTNFHIGDSRSSDHLPLHARINC